MSLLRRRVPEPALPLAQPSLDGSGWPDAAGLGRPSFEVQTTWELAQRRAAELDALGIAERLVDALLPVLRLDVPAEDAPHLRKTLVTAARLGVGLALLRPGPPHVVDRISAGALWWARGTLPATTDDLAAHCLLAGHWVARTDVSPHTRAVLQLVADARRHRPPG